MLKRTFLFDEHVRLNARLIDFGGWELPVQYDGIVAEHQRVRQEVAMFDTGHMGAIMVQGAGALDFLSQMLTQELRTLADGRCRYGFLLRDDGGILDDLIAYRLAADSWMLVVNAGTADGDLEWLTKHAPAAGVTLAEVRRRQAKIDVQGPQSRRVVEQALQCDLAALGPFRFLQLTAGTIVSRTGYTGELGYEIYAPAANIVTLWRKLLDLGVKPAGLGARDTLRLEAGLPLYGHEFTAELSPAEARMMRYARKEEPFHGRDALPARRDDKTGLRLTPFTIAGRQAARHGNRVLDADGTEVGYVTSGSFSPTLGRAIGFAYVKQDLTTPGTNFLVDNGRQKLAATVTTTPFVERDK